MRQLTGAALAGLAVALVTSCTSTVTDPASAATAACSFFADVNGGASVCVCATGATGGTGGTGSWGE